MIWISENKNPSPYQVLLPLLCAVSTTEETQAACKTALLIALFFIASTAQIFLFTLTHTHTVIFIYSSFPVLSLWCTQYYILDKRYCETYGFLGSLGYIERST
jgi:hypothetical protein